MIDTDETEVVSRHERAIELPARARGRDGVGDDPDGLGWALYMCGEKSRALRVFEENLEPARRLNHHALVNRSIGGACQLLVATASSSARSRWRWSSIPRRATAKTCRSCTRRITTSATAQGPARRLRRAASGRALEPHSGWETYARDHRVLGRSPPPGSAETKMLRLEGAINAKWKDAGARLSRNTVMFKVTTCNRS